MEHRLRLAWDCGVEPPWVAVDLGRLAFSFEAIDAPRSQELMLGSRRTRTRR
jgi:hypothetical protein